MGNFRTYIYARTHTHIYKHIYIYIQKYIYIYIWMYVCIKVYICFAVIGTNLAPEGKASQLQGNKWHNASKAIDGKSKRIYSTDTCTSTPFRTKNSWWKVDFKKLIAVKALEIKPGKCYMHTCIYGYVSYVNVNKIYRQWCECREQ